MKKKIFVIAAVLVSTLLIVSIIMIVSMNAEMRKNQEEFDSIASLIRKTETTDGILPVFIINTESPIKQKTEDITVSNNNYARFGELYRRNSDFAAWIQIEDTKINYPVMIKPDVPDYYLGRDFDKNFSSSGSIYIDKSCDLESDNILIHGHNMRNGTMFAGLLKFEKEDYYKEHPTIQFDTMEESGKYDIVAAFREKVHYAKEKGVFRYYNYAGKLTKEQYDEYVANCKKLCKYDTGITPEYGQQLITLSTCAYHTDNGRFVVLAVRRDD